MDLPWWGWLLVVLWLAAGVGGFGVFLRRFESAYAVWYFLIGEEGFRGPVRTVLRSIPLVAVLLFCLLLGPFGVISEVQTQRDERLKIERVERLREQRRQRKAAAAAAAGVVTRADD